MISDVCAASSSYAPVVSVCRDLFSLCANIVHEVVTSV